MRNRRLVTAMVGALMAIGGSIVLAPPAGASGEQHCAVNLDNDTTACSATALGAQRQVGAQALYLVAQLWEHADYRGLSLAYWKSGACTSTMSDREIPVPVVPSGWNDRITSIQTDLSTASTRCSLRLYEHGNYGGATFPGDLDHYSPNLGVYGWNDRVSSFYIS